VNGFIEWLQVVTTNNYYSIADLHILQLPHTADQFPGKGFMTQEL
jgi:hypothetical protein